MSKRLFFRKLEGGRGTPLLILHGLLGSSDNWLSVARRLAPDRVVYMPDLRNHGRSFHAQTHTLADMVADLESLLEEMGLKDLHLMGHSMGGKVAMQYGLSHGSKVRSLVAVDIGVKPYAVQHDALLGGLSGLDLTAYGKREEIARAMEAFVPTSRMRQFLLKNVDRVAEGYRWRIPVAVLHRHLPDIAVGVQGGVYKGSACFVYGGRSSYVVADDQAGIRRLFPQAVFRCLAEAGHWVHAEAAEAFTDVVSAFLRGCD